MSPYNPYLKPFAQKLRKDMTLFEKLLWPHLRRKQILGVQFYRQRAIGNFIVDFYCPQAKVVIELDGSQHFDLDIKNKDLKRDAYLQSLGMLVIRITNAEWNTNKEGVLEHIYNTIESRINK